MTAVAEVPAAEAPAPTPEQAVVPPAVEEVQSEGNDPSSQIGDDLWSGVEDDIFEEATQEINAEIAAEGGEEAGDAPAAAEEDDATAPPDEWAEKFAALEKRFEDTQRWAQQLSSEKGQIAKRLEELENGVQAKTSQAEQDAVFNELREAVKNDPEVFSDPDKLNDYILTASDKIVQARTAKAFERLDKATKEYEQGMILMAGFQQAGQHAPALQQAVGYMANEYAARNDGALIFDNFSPQQVLAGAWQLLQQQASQNTTQTQPAVAPEESQQQGSEGSTPPSPQQQPAPSVPAPRPATSQPVNTFTPESPSVGLSSGAVTTVTQGSPQDTRGAVLAALREVEQGG